MDLDGLTDSILSNSFFANGKIGEDEEGLEKEMHYERRKKIQKGGLKIGMMRNVVIILDMSKSMLENDFTPNRHQLSTVMLEKFTEEFFDRNPIAQLGLVATRNKFCEIIIDLCGNKRKILAEIKKVRSMNCEGEASLYNSFKQALKLFKNVPQHISKEVIVIFSSLSTIDPHNLLQMVDEMKKANVKCSIVGLSASLYVCQKICKETQGRYEVAMDETHFHSIMEDHLIPPIALTNQASFLVKMGFPELDSSPPVLSISCICHADDPEKSKNSPGYLCPQCSSKYCELPIDCLVCSLTLASSAHLARSYHHLFPLEPFSDIPLKDIQEMKRFCYSCQSLFTHAFQCNVCLSNFCNECNTFVHDNLHFCPSCSTI